MILKGRKVTLRAIEKRDLELLVDLLNDPEIEHMVVGYAPPISYEQEERWYENNMNNTDPMRWIIETERDGSVGIVSMGDFDWKNRVAHTTGIKLKEDRVTESGIAIDAMMTMFGYGFDELNLNRIEGEYLEYNKSAAALNKMVGLVIEGIQRKAVYKRGEYHDLVLTAILKSDYENRKQRKTKRKASV